MPGDDRLHAPRIPWLVEPKYDDDGVQATSGIDRDGKEWGDPTPMQPPIGLEVSQGDELHRSIRNLMIKERSLFQMAVEAEQFESEDEANDFAVAEDIFPPGNEPWEDVHEFPADPPRGVAGVGSGATLASSSANEGVPRPQEPNPSPTKNDPEPRSAGDKAKPE